MDATTRMQHTDTVAAAPSPDAPRRVRRRGELEQAVLACAASGPRGCREISRMLGCRPYKVRRVLARLARTGAAVESVDLADAGRLSQAILAFLAVPRGSGEVVRHTGAARGTVRGRLDTLVCTGQAARTGQGLYVATGQPCVVPDVPAAPRSAPHCGRPQPIRDAILAFLGEPRQARDVAAHINRPVSNATGHLAAMRRRGLVARTGPGRYERAHPAPDLALREGRAGLGLSSTPRAGSGHVDADAAQHRDAGSVPLRHVA